MSRMNKMSKPHQPRKPSMTEVLEEVLPNLEMSSGCSQYICDNVRKVADEFWWEGGQKAWENLAGEFGLDIHDCQQFYEYRWRDWNGTLRATEESQFARALLCTFMLEFLKDHPEFEYA